MLLFFATLPTTAGSASRSSAIHPPLLLLCEHCLALNAVRRRERICDLVQVSQLGQPLPRSVLSESEGLRTRRGCFLCFFDQLGSKA